MPPRKKKTPDVGLMLRTCRSDGGANHGFKWPLTVGAVVEAPDWRPDAECGHGLHGLRDGAGEGSLLDWSDDAVWMVCEFDPATAVDLGGKIKVPRCTVAFVGSRDDATAHLRARLPKAKRALCVGGTATAGVRGTATAGYAGTATAGVRGTATAGYAGTATAGYAGTATAGVRGTARAGYAGTARAGYAGTATAGDAGTATAGDAGTATAGVRGTATAGVRGTARAGYAGTATAGDAGTATAGDAGTARAGYAGTARAGDDGIVVIQRWTGDRYRYRLTVGVVGDGIDPWVWYVVDGDALRKATDAELCDKGIDPATNGVRP